MLCSVLILIGGGWPHNSLPRALLWTRAALLLRVIRAHLYCTLAFEFRWWWWTFRAAIIASCLWIHCSSIWDCLSSSSTWALEVWSRIITCKTTKPLITHPENTTVHALTKSGMKSQNMQKQMSTIWKVECIQANIMHPHTKLISNIRYSHRQSNVM